MQPLLSAADFAGPLTVTAAYIALYYAFMIRILAVKTRLQREYSERGERFDRYFGQDRELLAADRVQLNMLEHMGPFLVLLWLHALFVSAQTATVVGAVYVFLRAIYPVLLGRRLGRGIKGSIMASTAPGYLIIGYFVVSLLIAAWGGGA